MVVVIIELYPFIPLSVTLVVLQGHSSVKQFYESFMFLSKLKLCMIVDYIKEIINIPLFFIFLYLHMFKEMSDIFPPLTKKKINVAFFLDTIKARSFKLCMIIILLGVYIFIESLMTLTLFQGHRYVRNINCKLCFFDAC